MAAPLTDMAYGFILENVEKGRFVGGAMLSEVSLARELGTSRGPVREARQRGGGERGALHLTRIVADGALEPWMLRWQLRQACPRPAVGAAAAVEVAPKPRPPPSGVSRPS